MAQMKAALIGDDHQPVGGSLVAIEVLGEFPQHTVAMDGLDVVVVDIDQDPELLVLGDLGDAGVVAAGGRCGFAWWW